MLEVNILCTGLKGYKSRAFVFPILRYSKQLQRRGIDCTIHTSVSEDIDNCNILLIQDNVINHRNNIDVSLSDLHHYRESVDSLVWFDTTDSTGTIHTDALSIVDYYCKKQLLSDTTRYLDPMYGSRVYTDFYHKKFGIEDEGDAEENNPQIQVENKKDLNKLELAWNIGVVPNVPYLGYGWKILEPLPDTVYKKIPWDYLFDASPFWKKVNTSRTVDVSGRFSTNFDRRTVEYHREHMSSVFDGRYEQEKVSTKDYWSEIRNAKVLLSPFGWGEICRRDFEGFLSGNILLKPSMDHLETWPPLFEANQTYIDVSWDMEDGIKTLNRMLDEYEDYRKIAEAGQQRYREYLVGESAAKRFVDYFEELARRL